MQCTHECITLTRVDRAEGDSVLVEVLCRQCQAVGRLALALRLLERTEWYWTDHRALPSPAADLQGAAAIAATP